MGSSGGLDSRRHFRYKVLSDGSVTARPQPMAKRKASGSHPEESEREIESEGPEFSTGKLRQKFGPVC